MAPRILDFIHMIGRDCNGRFGFLTKEKLKKTSCTLSKSVTQRTKTKKQKQENQKHLGCLLLFINETTENINEYLKPEKSIGM